MKGTIDFYDDTAQSWADRWYNIDSFLPYLKQFCSFLPTNPRIAELCCGTGYDSMRLKKLGASVIGLDLSKEALKIARIKNPDIIFYQQDITKDYSYVGEVDGILCCAGLIHLNNDEMKTAFEHMNKILKPGGILFIVVYDGVGQRFDWQYITINEITYNRIFYRHSLDEIKTSIEGMFEFVAELNHDEDDKWRYYILKKDF